MTEGNFVDYVKIYVSSGKGGKGSTHLHREKFIEKCNFVKKYYPERYMEFYSESIKRSFNILGRKENFFVPIPRSIEFFSIFEELKTMEKITNASVNFVDFLMGDLEFSPFKWTDSGDIVKIG